MSRHRREPGHAPTIEIGRIDQPREIVSHRRTKRRAGRRRAFLAAFSITLLLGSAAAFGARLRHDHVTAVLTGRHGESIVGATALPSPSPIRSSSGGDEAGQSASPSPHQSASTSPSASPIHRATASPTATQRGATSTQPKATSTQPQAAPPSAPSATGQIIKAYLTGYSYFDNTPPGSVDISNPILHKTAGGTGTYDDPITVAVGHSLIGGRDVLDWPAGTKFYVPNLHRYFIAEDTCGDGSNPQAGACHVGYPASATTWLDLWIGGAGGTVSGSNACMDAITGVWSVVVKPAAGLATVTGSVYGPGGCTAQYGNTVTASVL